MMFFFRSGWVWRQAALMWVGMVTFFGLLIWGGYALVRGGRGPVQRTLAQSARSILDQRLARGEVDQNQYQDMRELIGAGPGPGPAGGRQ